MASIEVNDDEIVRALQKMKDAAGDISPALKEIGEILVESTKQRFASSQDPEGNLWVPNSKVTIDRKGKNRPLIDIGTLSEHIIYDVLVGNVLEIGSSMEYAAIQQFGGTKDEFPHLWGDIPSRPFLGISSADKEEILLIIEEHLADSMR
jgi:phage virion morphogenesis protein